MRTNDSELSLPCECRQYYCACRRASSVAGPGEQLLQVPIQFGRQWSGSAPLLPTSRAVVAGYREAEGQERHLATQHRAPPGQQRYHFRCEENDKAQ